MTNISSSHLPYAGYPPNAVGANNTTKDLSSYCYDTQRNAIAKSYTYSVTENKQDLTWPVVGSIVSFLSLLAIGYIKRGKI